MMENEIINEATVEVEIPVQPPTVTVELSKIIDMRKSGRFINCLCHFTRNNPRTTEYYYNRLVSLFGADVWNQANAPFKLQWENAKYSFDRMYGLVKGWCKAEAVLTLVLPAEDAKDKIIKRLKKELKTAKKSKDELQAEKQEEIDLLNQQMEDEKMRFNEATEALNKAAEALNQAAEEVRRSKAAIEVTVRNEPKKGDQPS